MTFVEHLTEYVAIQRTLLAALAQRIDLSGREYFNDLPRGELIAAGKPWRFAGHGRGVRFEALDDATVVDVHVLPTVPDALDGWRLALYLESRGDAAVHHDGRSYPRTEATLEDLLRRLAADGLLHTQTIHTPASPITVYRPNPRGIA